eukprot:1658144-Amphidinium_carterae.1
MGENGTSCTGIPHDLGGMSRFGGAGMGPAVTSSSLEGTKSELRSGVRETAIISNPLAVAMLQWVSRGQSPGVRLYPFSQQHLRDEFHALCMSANLAAWRFQPYSLRRGGATYLFQQCGRLDVVVLRGRWSQSRVARIYINEALAVLSDFNLSPSSRKVLHNHAVRLSVLFLPSRQRG